MERQFEKRLGEVKYDELLLFIVKRGGIWVIGWLVGQGFIGLGSGFQL